MSGYSCKQCGAEAFPEAGGSIRRTCEHNGTIIASMQAVAYGEGHMDDKPSRLARIVALIVGMVKGK
jgi:hypothetical protein